MFERPGLLWLMIAVPLVAAPGIVAFTRSRRLAGALEAVVRALAGTMIVLLLAGLALPVHVGARRLAVVAAIDQSRSIAPDQEEWMRGRIRLLAMAMDPTDQIAVIGFGRDVKLLAPLGDPRLLAFGRGAADGGASDIEAAMVAATGLFPDAADKRLVLLTDGNQTQGDAVAQAQAMAADGVRIYAAAPPPSTLNRVALTALRAPSSVHANERFVLRIEIQSEAKQPVESRITFFAHGHREGDRMVTLRPGLNRFAMPYQIDRAGTYELGVGLEAPAPIVETSSHATAVVTVSPPPHVLLVSSIAEHSLARALRLRNYRVDEVPPGALPDDPHALLNYQVVVLGDVTAATLTPSMQTGLAEYARRFGGGLIVTGGTMLDAHFKGGPLEKALPVLFEPQPPPPSREPVAVYLCIDRSNSMGYNSRDPDQRDGERIRYAKRAAIALLNELDDTDFAGVIAFDSQPYVLSHLRPLGEDRAELIDRIQRLEPGGGTDFKEALEIAEREILLSGLSVRQVILLTDGDTNREYHDHDTLIDDYRREQIPVSTVRIGPDEANLRLLEDFARATGGTFYRVTDIRKLPQLLVHLSRHTVDRGHRNRGIEAGDPSLALSGIPIDRIPQIDYVAQTHLKNGAAAPLLVRRGGKAQPLLASWQYGLGRVAVFTADPDALTSLSWIRWDRYAQFWSQLVGWVMREGAPGLFDFRVNASASDVNCEAQKVDTDPVVGLYCRMAGGDIVIDTVMSQVGNTFYRGDVGPLPVGKYTATLMLKANDEEQLLARRQFIVTAATPEEAELRLRPPNLDLLRSLAVATGGSNDVSPRTVMARRGRTLVVYRTPTSMLLPCAIVLMVAAVFIRKRFIT
jgi:Mg-chelatase subunit ChlD/uncharacterized membrane protein